MGRWRDNADLVLANLLFGANFSFYVSLSREQLDFRTLFALQLVVGAVVFIPPALLKLRLQAFRWRDLLKIGAVSLLVIYGWMYMLLWGSSYTTPIDAAIISTLGPFFTLWLDWLLHRTLRFNPSRIVGMGIILLGGWLLIFDKGFQLVHGSEGWGNLIVLCGVVAIAFNTVLIKPQLERLGARTIIGLYVLIGVLISLPLMRTYLTAERFASLTWVAWGEVGYVVLLGSVWPMWLLYRATEHLTAVHTALYRYIQPLVAGTLAHLRHQAQFDATNITALGLLFVGILLTVVGYRESLRFIGESLAPRRLRRRR